MGPVFDWPTWDEYVAALQLLLHDTARWLVMTWPGQVVLITLLVILSAMLFAGFGKAEAL
jgi:hypothetical protein